MLVERVRLFKEEIKVFHGKKSNLFFRVTALLTACFIVIGMSGIQSLAEGGDSSDESQTTVTEESTPDDQSQSEDENSDG